MDSRTARRWQLLRLVLDALSWLVATALVVVGAVVVALRVAERPGPLLWTLAVVAAVLAAAAGAAAALAKRVPRRTVLELDLTVPLSDGPPGDAFTRAANRGRPGLREVVETLERASRDRRVVGLFARVGGVPGGLATVQELREAISAFRAAGKPAVAHAETFGEFAGASGAYYLASAFDEIHLQPSGDVGLVGLATHVPFLRGTLDKLGIVPRMDHRHEYKNAANTFTERDFTPAHQEATTALVESLFEQVVTGVAERRGLPPAQVRALVDRAPLTAAEAHEAGLVDRLAYRDETVAAVKAAAGDGAALLPLAGYRRRTTTRARRGTRVALVVAHGNVVQGRPSPWARTSLTADRVTAALRQAAADDKTKAILFRVDSPGGSYIASDAIWREVVRAREQGTPVVVSMGEVAASGGYFVAMAADRIVAHPATLTGSIGVLGGKLVTTGLQAKLGLHTGTVRRGAHALLGSPSADYDEGEWQVLQRWLDRVYDDFTGKVARGRGLTADRARELAKGRVWTGAQAAERGLVDRLGGYPAALAEVRDLLGLPADAPLRLRTYPRPASLLARLSGGGEQSSDEAATTALGWGLTGLARRLGLPVDEGVLSADLPDIRG